jgi:DNA-binding PadR family transcriptional regulator
MTARGRLSPAEFQVMLALADGSKHGHAIKLDVRERTDGVIDMGPGTLYGAIKRLLRSRWIVEVADGGKDTPDDERRRYYEVTPDGLAAAREEAVRMSALVGIALDKDLITG